MLFFVKDEGLSPYEALLPEDCRSIEKQLAVRIVSAGWRRGVSPWAIQLEAESTLPQFRK